MVAWLSRKGATKGEVLLRTCMQRCTCVYTQGGKGRHDGVAAELRRSSGRVRAYPSYTSARVETEVHRGRCFVSC